MSHLRYMQEAQNIARAKSHDKKTQVGSVLVHCSLGIVGRGWNTEVFPGAVKDWFDKSKHSHVIHAEMNCLFDYYNNLNGQPCKGLTLYVTLEPCIECCKMIIASGIITQVVFHELKNGDTYKYLEDAGIEVDRFIFPRTGV